MIEWDASTNRRLKEALVDLQKYNGSLDKVLSECKKLEDQLDALIQTMKDWRKLDEVERILNS